MVKLIGFIAEFYKTILMFFHGRKCVWIFDCSRCSKKCYFNEVSICEWPERRHATFRNYRVSEEKTKETWDDRMTVDKFMKDRGIK
jgi:hypothetical protein